MSESDKKGPENPSGGEFDWDGALEPWAEEGSDLDAAPDLQAKKPALSPGTPLNRVSRPLYRPPSQEGSPPAVSPPRFPKASRSLPPRPAPRPTVRPLPLPAHDGRDGLERSDAGIDVELVVADPSPDEPDRVHGTAATTMDTPLPSPRVPDPGRGLEQVFDSPSDAFEADDADVDALLGGPSLQPQRLQADTLDLEAYGAQSEQTSGAEPPLSEDDVSDSEPTRNIDAFAIVPAEGEQDPEADAVVSSMPATRKAPAVIGSSRPSATPWSEKPTRPHAVVPPPVPSHDIAESVQAMLRERADWLEEEAVTRSGVERARLLLTLSEDPSHPRGARACSRVRGERAERRSRAPPRPQTSQSSVRRSSYAPRPDAEGRGERLSCS